MSEFKTLTFKEISDALNAGKHVDVDGCGSNPFKIIKGCLVDRDGSSLLVSKEILKAMHGQLKARIVEPKLTRWIVAYDCGEPVTVTASDEDEKNRKEKYYKEKGTWLRTVKVEV